MRYHFFNIFALVFLFSSCGKQKSLQDANGGLEQSSDQASEQKMASALMLQKRLGNLKHFDIPIPLTFSQTNISSKKNKDRVLDFMAYTGKLPVNQTVSFYKREMECSGWKIVNLSTKKDGFLYCNKPNKECGIQIRKQETLDSQEETGICFFISQKT